MPFQVFLSLRSVTSCCCCIDKISIYKVGQFQFCKVSLKLLTHSLVSTFLLLTNQRRVLSIVESCLLFVVSVIINADMVMFTRRDATQRVKRQYKQI